MDPGQATGEGRGSLCLQIEASTMMDPGQATGEARGNLHLQIDYASTIFNPQFNIDTTINTTTNPSSPSGHTIHAPEKKLTLFAFQLAVLEKAATGLGALGFIWATVVLLGGFAMKLGKTDFWFITIILLIEGTRIFSRSHELKWQQHQSTWSVTVLGRNSFRAIRSSSLCMLETVKATGFQPIDQSQHSSREKKQLKLPTRKWETGEVPILPFPRGIFRSKNVSKVLYWLQLVSGTACAVLSLMKLIKRDFTNTDGDADPADLEKRDHKIQNRNAALILFYSLALAEALLFLLEKAYWERKVTYCKLLEEVNKECELGPSGVISITRFFYDAYSRCINGSVFNGLNMDMVSFAMDLLASDSPDEQLVGIRVLRKFATNKRFSYDTLQKIGTTLPVMERLVDMLNWVNGEEVEIRISAAEILSILAGKKQNALRVSSIPGAMESISSLLQSHRTQRGTVDEILEKTIIQDNQRYSFWKSNQLGLLILKKLARDHDNCGKIGSTRGLLPKIIGFTHTGESLLLNDEDVIPCQINEVKRSLQVLKMLASMTGSTGKLLRAEIFEDVFTISNIRDILKYGEKHTELQKLGIQILRSLAMEAGAAERIGGTGGILKELFNILFKQEMLGNQQDVRIAAGEALAMLAFESKSNCRRILKLKVIGRLVEELGVPFLRINAARILSNLCVNIGAHGFMQLRRVIDAAPTVLRAIMSEENKLIMSEESKFFLITEENKLQEVMVGLAANVFKLMTTEASSLVFERSGIQEAELAGALIQILRKYQNPAIKAPRIRRFVIELATWMMSHNEASVQIFKDLGMIKEMESIIDTTSELENFNVFCGTFGMSRHSTTIHSLVETAMKLLKTSNAKPCRVDISK